VNCMVWRAHDDIVSPLLYVVHNLSYRTRTAAACIFGRDRFHCVDVTSESSGHNARLLVPNSFLFFFFKYPLAIRLGGIVVNVLATELKVRGI
jgi:hypothetical protein